MSRLTGASARGMIPARDFIGRSSGRRVPCKARPTGLGTRPQPVKAINRLTRAQADLLPLDGSVGGDHQRRRPDLAVEPSRLAALMLVGLITGSGSGRSPRLRGRPACLNSRPMMSRRLSRRPIPWGTVPNERRGACGSTGTIAPSDAQSSPDVGVAPVEHGQRVRCAGRIVRESGREGVEDWSSRSDVTAPVARKALRASVIGSGSV